MQNASALFGSIWFIAFIGCLPGKGKLRMENDKRTSCAGCPWSFIVESGIWKIE